jgi:hypothetical protein
MGDLVLTNSFTEGERFARRRAAPELDDDGRPHIRDVGTIMRFTPA